MIISAFHHGEKLKLRDITYYLYNKHWDRYDLKEVNLNFANWTTIKYLNSNGSSLNNDTSKLPNDSGGLYMFSINCPIISGMTQYPVYIGRALLSEGENLRARCRSYFTKYARSDERPMITTMFKYWKKELMLSFLPLADNSDIIDYEKRLINALILPFNDFIPDIEIRQAKKAFRL